MNSSSFISIHEILSDVVTYVGDEEFNQGIPRGWYLARIHDGLRELALDTYYPKKTEIIPLSQNMNVPDGCFNVKEMYAFSGDLKNNKSLKEIHWKRKHNSIGVKSSKINENSYHDVVRRRGYSGINVLYCSFQNGLIMFSDSCLSYEKLKIIYNGTSFSDDKCLIVPEIFKQAIVDFSVEKALRRIKQKDKSRRTDWQDAYNILNNNGGRNPGSWKLAKRRALSLTTFEKEAFKDYMSNYEF